MMGGNFDAQGNTSMFGIPAGMMGNVTAGQAVWSGSCTNCHATGSKDGLGYSTLQSALNISAMSGLNVTSQQMADLVAYLNRNNSGSSAGGGTGSGGGGTTGGGMGVGNGSDDESTGGVEAGGGESEASDD